MSFGALRVRKKEDRPFDFTTRETPYVSLWEIFEHGLRR